MTLERGIIPGVQDKPPIPFSSSEYTNPPTKTDLFSKANELINGTVRVLTQSKEFIESMSSFSAISQDRTFNFKVSFQYMNYDYTIRYVGRNLNTGSPRRLIIERSFNLSDFGDGPQIKEKAVVVASDKKPVIAWAMKISDGSLPVDKEINTPKAIELVKHSMAFIIPNTEIAPVVVKRPKEKSIPQQNVPTIDNEQQAETPRSHSLSTPNRKWAELVSLIRNPDYRSSQIRKRVETVLWELKVKTKYR